MRALCLEPEHYDAETRALLGQVTALDDAHCESGAELVAALGQAPYEAVFVRLGLAMDQAALAAAPRMRFIVTPTTGVDHIDVEAAERRGVRVISLRGATSFLDSIRSTAEHTWALLLALFRHLPAAHADVLEGRWRRAPFLAEELSGRTLGIVGCGRLGSMVARYGLAFGMRVVCHDLKTDVPDGAQWVALDDLLGAADVVSLHLPLGAATRGFLSAPRLGRMKRGALLINTSRGEIVNEEALLDALRRGHLGGAALDVLAGDSRWPDGGPGPTHPLIAYARSNRNLVLTPHMGGYGRQSISRTRKFVAQAFIDALTRGL